MTRQYKILEKPGDKRVERLRVKEEELVLGPVDAVAGSVLDEFRLALGPRVGLVRHGATIPYSGHVSDVLQLVVAEVRPLDVRCLH